MSRLAAAPRAATVDRIVEPLARVRRIQRHVPGTGPEHREDRDHERRGSIRIDGNGVGTRRQGAAQPDREGRRGGVELGVGQLTVRPAYGDGVRQPRGMGGEQVVGERTRRGRSAVPVARVRPGGRRRCDGEVSGGYPGVPGGLGEQARVRVGEHSSRRGVVEVGRVLDGRVVPSVGRGYERDGEVELGRTGVQCARFAHHPTEHERYRRRVLHDEEYLDERRAAERALPGDVLDQPRERVLGPAQVGADRDRAVPYQLLE
jgi:hypothetical protein